MVSDTEHMKRRGPGPQCRGVGALAAGGEASVMVVTRCHNRSRHQTEMEVFNKRVKQRLDKDNWREFSIIHYNDNCKLIYSVSVPI